MKKRFTEEQIIGILKEAEAGLKVGELCRKHGISDATYYNWKSKFGGMSVSEAQRLRALDFNGRFRDECLNEHWFLSMRHAREVIEIWRKEYNEERPHSSLKDMTPKEFADRFLTADSTSNPY